MTSYLSLPVTVRVVRLRVTCGSKGRILPRPLHDPAILPVVDRSPSPPSLCTPFFYRKNPILKVLTFEFSGSSLHTGIRLPSGRTDSRPHPSDVDDEGDGDGEWKVEEVNVVTLLTTLVEPEPEEVLNDQPDVVREVLEAVPRFLK